MYLFIEGNSDEESTLVVFVDNNKEVIGNKINEYLDQQGEFLEERVAGGDSNVTDVPYLKELLGDKLKTLQPNSAESVIFGFESRYSYKVAYLDVNAKYVELQDV